MASYSSIPIPIARLICIRGVKRVKRRKCLVTTSVPNKCCKYFKQVDFYSNWRKTCQC